MLAPRRDAASQDCRPNLRSVAAITKLGTNPAWGVRIARYSLAPKQIPPTTTTPGEGPVPPSTLTPPQPSHAPTPT
jgi:hypothetical protein